MLSPTRRARPSDSIPSIVEEILDEILVPVPTSAVRVIASERRGAGVTAEHLSRIAAYERSEFERSRLPPRLCVAIDVDGRAPSPRVWARGDWRLQRRIMSPDVVAKWQAALAAHLCHEMAQRPQLASRAFVQLAVESVARVLGPESAYVPGSPDGWMGLRTMVVSVDPSVVNDPAGATSAQIEAEQRLDAELPPSERYFGRR